MKDLADRSPDPSTGPPMFDLRQKARSPAMRSHYRSKSGSHGAFISLPALSPGGKSHRDNNENKFLSLLNTHVGSTFEDGCDKEQNVPNLEQKNSLPSLIRPSSLCLRRKRDRNRHGNNEPSWVSAILEYECTVPNICYDQMEYEEYCRDPAGQDDDQGYVNEQPLMPMQCPQHKSLTMMKKANARQQRQRQDSGKKQSTLTNSIKRIVNMSKDTTEHNKDLEKKMKMTGRKKNSAHYRSNDYPDSTAWDTVHEENVGRFDSRNYPPKSPQYSRQSYDKSPSMLMPSLPSYPPTLHPVPAGQAASVCWFSGPWSELSCGSVGAASGRSWSCQLPGGRQRKKNRKNWLNIF